MLLIFGAQRGPSEMVSSCGVPALAGWVGRALNFDFGDAFARGLGLCGMEIGPGRRLPSWAAFTWAITSAALSSTGSLLDVVGSWAGSLESSSRDRPLITQPLPLTLSSPPSLPSPSNAHLRLLPVTEALRAFSMAA